MINYHLKDFTPPDSKTTTGKICLIGDLTLTNRDLEEEIHKGFTIGKGKKLYWMMIFHSTGYGVSVYSIEPKNAQPKRRWINCDTEITVHFK